MRNKRNKRPISKNAVCATKTIYICSSAVFCILGVFLFMIGKTGTIRHAWIICSICLILHGCIEINGHHIKDLYMLAFKNGSYVGVLCILMGIIILFFVRGHTDCLYVLLGTGLLADALEKIELTRPARSFGIVFWWLILGAGILTACSSAYLIISQILYDSVPGWKMGLLLFFTGVLNAATALTAVHGPTKPHPMEAVFLEDSPWGL